MIDYSKELVSALSPILPTYYEMFLTPAANVPCISYLQLNNYDEPGGETVGYSHISYQIKVWGKDLSTVNGYAAQIDKILRPLGFERTNCGELYDANHTMLQKIMTYEALGYEVYNQ